MKLIIPPKEIPVVDGKKQCVRCGEQLPLDAFTRTAQTKSGYFGTCRNCHRNDMRRIKFGIGQKEYDAMLAAQKGRCAACGEQEFALSRSRRPKPLGIDHDHVSGKIRGLLCSACNCAIGFVGDNPERLVLLAAYLNGRVAP